MRPISVLPPTPTSPASPEVAPTLAELEELSDAEVTNQVTTWAGRVAAGEARLLLYVSEFDRRKAWAGVGILSCAHWLSWRLGMGEKAAFERVRVARALRTLPRICAAFSAGRLSWTQVRAVTRVACPDDEETYLNLARHATGRQIEKLARGVRRARRLADAARDPEAVQPIRARVRYDEDGSMLLTVRMPAEDGAVVLAAVEAARSDLDAERRGAPPAVADSSAEDSPAPRGATLGEGLLHLGRTYLRRRAQAHPDRSRRDRAKLTMQIDPLSGWARLPDGEFLPPDALIARPLRPADLTRYDAGRDRREPDQAQRELLGALDGERCRYPGCCRRRKLHAHHVRWWSEGGRTDLANLVLLCSRHHTLVHRREFVLTLRADRTLVVTTASGAPVPHRPVPPWRSAAELDPNAAVGPGTLPPQAHDRLDLHYAVSVLLQQAA